ncbi:hypothetical protein [Streptomyces sp. NPDC048411]|uniref:hypothetical protein n=1 Tax=Streptomyces sp. NPDC048411 TaxID=3157206 RepID=UPI0034549D16
MVDDVAGYVDGIVRVRPGHRLQSSEAPLGDPGGTVREVVYPAISGGEQTLRELVHEFKTRDPVYRRTVQTTLKASYTNHYRRGLIKLLDVQVFIDELREQMTTELTLLNDRLPTMAWLDIAERKSGAIRLMPAEARPEPRNLRRIKAEVQRRRGIVPLIDVLKEAVLRTGS